MGIEARGGKDAWCCALAACKIDGSTVTTRIGQILETADSEEEAEGRAMRIVRRQYPSDRGWRDHFVTVKKITGFDWVSRFDIETVKP